LINPQSSGLYYTIASSCVNLRLYQRGRGLRAESVELNPRDWQAMSVLGVNLLRIGREDEGIATLRERSECRRSLRCSDVEFSSPDRYMEGLDVITTEHFRIKLNKKEKRALKPYVTDLLEKHTRRFLPKYGFTPQGPIGFEMYPNHDDFAVRTLGVPGLGALGVCFGKLV